MAVRWIPQQPAYDVAMLAAQAELRADWVSHYLFESPWLIIAGLAILWTVLRIAGRRTGNAKLSRISWIPLSLAVVAWFGSVLITTPREELNTALDNMLLAVEDQDFETFRSIVPEDAEAFFPPGKAAERHTREQVERRLQDANLSDLILLGADSAMENDREAVSVIRVRAQGDYRGVSGVQIYKWAIKWRYVDGRWQARHFECLEIGFSIGNNRD